MLLSKQQRFESYEKGGPDHGDQHEIDDDFEPFLFLHDKRTPFDIKCMFKKTGFQYQEDGMKLEME